jgi:hypothetical protein
MTSERGPSEDSGAPDSADRAVREIPATLAAAGGLAVLFGLGLGFIALLVAPLGFAQGLNAIALPLSVAAIAGGVSLLFLPRLGTSILVPTMLISEWFLVAKIGTVGDIASAVTAVLFLALPVAVLGTLLRHYWRG